MITSTMITSMKTSREITVSGAWQSTLQAAEARVDAATKALGNAKAALHNQRRDAIASIRSHYPYPSDHVVQVGLEFDVADYAYSMRQGRWRVTEVFTLVELMPVYMSDHMTREWVYTVEYYAGVALVKKDGSLSNSFSTSMNANRVTDFLNRSQRRAKG